MARQNTVQIIINADDRASKEISGIKGAMGGLRSALGGIGKVAMVGFGAVAAGAAAAAGGILKLASDAAAIEPIERDFARLSDSIGETGQSILSSLREASYGMVSNADLMQAANRLISMGLAESSEEAGEFTRMAVRLGEAMGKGPTEAMEEFALMMANTSIPRLDTFGISAGKVRARIKELMGETAKGGITQGQLNTAIGKSSQKVRDLQAQLQLAALRQSEYTEKTKESTKVAAQMRIDKLNQQLAEEQRKLSGLRNTTVSLTTATKALTREEAFAQAVRELGAESLERIGEGGKGAAASMARLGATFSNIKDTVGKAFVPVLAALLEPIGQLAQKYGPLVIEWSRAFASWLEYKLIPAVTSFGKTVWAWISEGVIPIFRSILTAIPWQQIIDTIDAVLTPIKALASGIVQWIGGTAIPGLQGLLTAVGWDDMAAKIGGLSGAFSDVGKSAQEGVGQAVAEAAVFDKAWYESTDHVNRLLGVNKEKLGELALAMGDLGDAATGQIEPSERLFLELQAGLESTGETAQEQGRVIDRSLTGKLSRAFRTVHSKFLELWEPMVQGISTFLTETLIPNFAAWVGVFEAVGSKGFEMLAGAWQNILGPALRTMATFISETLQGALEGLIDYLTTKVLTEFGKAQVISDKLKGAFDKLAGAIDWATEMLNALKEAIKGFKPPPLLTPGSPTAMELALRGIADAAREASGAMGGMVLPKIRPGLGASLGGALGPAMAGAGAAAGTTGGRPFIVFVNLDSRKFQNARGDYDYRQIGDFLLSVEKGL